MYVYRAAYGNLSSTFEAVYAAFLMQLSNCKALECVGMEVAAALRDLQHIMGSTRTNFNRCHPQRTFKFRIQHSDYSSYSDHLQFLWAAMTRSNVRHA